MPSNTKDTYTPSTLLNIFSNALSVQEEKKVIQIKGIYKKENSINYNGYFYDHLIDEIENQLITIRIPEKLRKEFKDGYTYVVEGYLNKKVNKSGHIDICFNAIDIQSNEGKRFFENEIRIYDVRKMKFSKGYKNVNEILRRKIYNKQKVSIFLIYGNNSIILPDILNALGGANKHYDIKQCAVNLSTKDDIIRGLNEGNKNYDVVVLARGGGWGLDMFNDPDIAEKAIQLEPAFVTAIGHAVDNNLLQDVADMRLDTPTALGNYLKEIANDVETAKRREEELESKLKRKSEELEKNKRECKYKIIKWGVLLFISGIIIGSLILKHI